MILFLSVILIREKNVVYSICYQVSMIEVKEKMKLSRKIIIQLSFDISFPFLFQYNYYFTDFFLDYLKKTRVFSY